MMFVFWIVVIAGVFFLVRWLASSANRGHGATTEETALDILKKRYAKGDISKDEYERINKVFHKLKWIGRRV